MNSLSSYIVPRNTFEECESKEQYCTVGSKLCVSMTCWWIGCVIQLVAIGFASNIYGLPVTSHPSLCAHRISYEVTALDEYVFSGCFNPIIGEIEYHHGKESIYVSQLITYLLSFLYRKILLTAEFIMKLEWQGVPIFIPIRRNWSTAVFLLRKSKSFSKTKKSRVVSVQ